MPIRETDPWRLQYFDGVGCPEDVMIPTEDGDAWQWLPEHKWVYDKLRVAESQGFVCGPHGVDPPSFPVFSKPIFNMRGMGVGSRVLRTEREYKANTRPGHIWMPMLSGEHVSTDVAVVSGAIAWSRHTVGLGLEGGMFDYWTVLAERRPAIEDYLAEWIGRSMPGYTGMMNFETIGAKIIEVHLRFADQWPDLYGGWPWVEALVGLYRDGEWRFDDDDRRDGYSVVLFGGHGLQYSHPPAEVQAEVRATPGVESLQITFHQDRPAAWHAMPPGGFRLAIVNTYDLELGRRMREKLALSFWSTQTLTPARARPALAAPPARRPQANMAAAFDATNLDRIEEIENLWIPMPDGVRLAARLWRPKDARVRPVPAILEYLPYRKRDFMRARDEPMHRFYALAGYASIRVDVRGTGDSEGLIYDEYSQTEIDDGVAVIAWLAAQPWCDGGVGMTGISWGGFNSLQIAARRPPALKAIITLCASDDRYSDDAHYKGGCLLNENMQWGSILMMNNALPPDPEIQGDAWRAAWRARIEALEPFPALWMRHAARDDYWRHGSVSDDLDAIACPVYAIGGWADGYSNAVPRLVAGLKSPVKGLIGPWAHTFPHEGVPGPSIGYLQEATRWWDHWLKGRDSGLMDEPVLRVWMQESLPPRPHYETRPGRWVAEAAWPSPRITRRIYYLDWGHLADQPGTLDEALFSSPATLGVRGGEWCGFGSDGEAPRDQRVDDGGSLVFTSDTLAESVELMGAPKVELDVRSDQPAAFLVARLCDVHPDGTSSRISYGVINLCHAEAGQADPRPLTPGVWRRVRLQLDDLAQIVPAGHALRLSLSTAYWPMLWPSPVSAALSVRIGTGELEIPVRPPLAADADLRPFEPPVSAPGARQKSLRRLAFRRSIEIDLTTNEMTYTLHSDGGDGGASLARIEEINLDLGVTLMKRYRIIEDDSLSAQTELAQTTTLRRGDWAIRVDCRTRLTATAEAFQFSADLEAFENEAPFAERRWTIAIPRRCL